jgi:ribosomal protein S18 acetylase RimI-like enzyme
LAVSPWGPAGSAEAFVDFAERYRLDVSRQAAAFDKGRLVASALFMINRGAAAAVMLPDRFPDLSETHHYDDVARAILQLLTRQIEPWDLALIQSVIRPGEQRKIALFSSAGFEVLAELIIMQAPVGPTQGDASNEPASAIHWLPYNEDIADRFARTLVETYRSSRDCPKLNGLRTGAEIVEGHRYEGIYEPRGWWLMTVEGRDAGVLLMNRTEEDSHRLELVYMGIVDGVRGRGIGRWVMRQAMQTAKAMGKEYVRLAVDTRNGPAMRLYQSFGFKEAGRQLALAVLNETRRRRLKGTTDT